MTENIAIRRLKEIEVAAKRIKNFHNSVERCKDEADFIVRLVQDTLAQIVPPQG